MYLHAIYTVLHKYIHSTHIMCLWWQVSFGLEWVHTTHIGYITMFVSCLIFCSKLYSMLSHHDHNFLLALKRHYGLLGVAIWGLYKLTTQFYYIYINCSKDFIPCDYVINHWLLFFYPHRFTENDAIPDLVRSKLESLVHVVSTLSCWQ